LKIERNYKNNLKNGGFCNKIGQDLTNQKESKNNNE